MEAYFAYVEMTGNCLNSKQTGITVAGREALRLQIDRHRSAFIDS